MRVNDVCEPLLRAATLHYVTQVLDAGKLAMFFLRNIILEAVLQHIIAFGQFYEIHTSSTARSLWLYEAVYAAALRRISRVKRYVEQQRRLLQSSSANLIKTTSYSKTNTCSTNVTWCYENKTHRTWLRERCRIMEKTHGKRGKWSDFLPQRSWFTIKWNT